MLIYCAKYTLHCIFLTFPPKFFKFKIFSRTQLSDFHHNAKLSPYAKQYIPLIVDFYRGMNTDFWFWVIFARCAR
jgi:hypothetical protein